MKFHRFVAAIFATTLIVGASAKSMSASSKNTIIGVALSPAHFPYPSDRDIDQFFGEAAQIGSHVTWIVEWESLPPTAYFKAVQEKARSHGLKFQLWLSPIALMGGRKNPAIPKSIGGDSFGDANVRRAYIEEVLELASLKPDYLGLATEVNFLAQNPPEFVSFVSLAHEAYGAIKKKYPAQIVTLSFQWEVMTAQHQFAMLPQFAGSLDVYSFTSYPDAFGDPAKVKVAPDYYSSVRKILPTQRIGFSEIGWSSAAPSNEDQQAAFFARMPELTAGARLEFVTLALLHDVSLFSADLERLNHVGIRTIDDSPKKSWDAILNLPELQQDDVAALNSSR
ncbi:MAG TPA: hypothetical protein VN867_06425 [Candidatus Binataceae bacterium]|nr:hypothetical protein [Candidatus Binataceae bacterium]